MMVFLISERRTIISAKGAKQSDKFPCGPLCTRRTTKLETCAKRYANDCLALQEFIYDDDPKHLTDVIAKRRTIVKSEPGAPKSLWSYWSNNI